MPPPVPPRVKEGRMTAGRPVISRTFCASSTFVAKPLLRDLEPDPGHGLLEELAVLADLDRAAARADEAHAEPVEDARGGRARPRG